ncbi:MAG: hypothetical protein ACJ0BI_05530 [Paracoccaceae bacterium]
MALLSLAIMVTMVTTLGALVAAHTRVHRFGSPDDTDNAYLSPQAQPMMVLLPSDDVDAHRQLHCFETMAGIWTNVTWAQAPKAIVGRRHSRLATDLGAHHDLLPQYGLVLPSSRTSSERHKVIPYTRDHVHGGMCTPASLGTFLRYQLDHWRRFPPRRVAWAAARFTPPNLLAYAAKRPPHAIVLALLRWDARASHAHMRMHTHARACICPCPYPTPINAHAACARPLLLTSHPHSTPHPSPHPPPPTPSASAPSCTTRRT